MIISELLRNGTLIKNNSDRGMMILQEETGIEYDEAIDVVPCRYTYKETNHPSIELISDGAVEDVILDSIIP